MNIFNKLSLLLILLWFSIPCIAQTDTLNKVHYSPGYTFHEGVYMDINQFLDNAPIPLVSLVLHSESENNLLTEVSNQKTLIYLDQIGTRKELNSYTIWAIVFKNVLYIQYNKKFYRVPYVGSIGHFIATETVYHNYDPMYYNGYYPMMGNSSYQSEQLIQCIIDFESGKIYPYNSDALLALLVRDPLLYDEYNQLKKRKKKQLIFLYIRKYNERHPLWLPITNE